MAGLVLAIGAAPAAAEVEEILVTAQRRVESQSLQDVPVAVTAFGEEQIATRQIDAVKDIGQNVPNLQTYTVTAGSEAGPSPNPGTDVGGDCVPGGCVRSARHHAPPARRSSNRRDS